VKVLVEYDGILCDLRKAWYQAYTDAVRAIGLARCDEETFWRLVRSGSDDGQLVRGARPKQLENFRIAFNASLESDATLHLLQLEADVAPIFASMGATYTLVFVTCGANVAARTPVITALNLPADALHGLPAGPTSVRADAVSTLARADAPGLPAVVLCSTDTLARAADEAGLTPIGIASGPVAARRLEGSGTRVVYPRLESFEEARRGGDAHLARLGFAAPRTLSVNDGPKSPPSALDRAADRLRRRRERNS
jgi:phosphoglycolate phosphatase-like HAD superfamily hydrolase